MFNKKQLEIIEKAIEVFGKNKQVIKSCEELAELIMAVAKYRLGEGNRGNVVEEIADVLIMIEDIKIMFNIPMCDIQDVINAKLERLEGRINEKNSSC